MTFLSKVDTTAMAVRVLHSLPAIHFLARLSLAAFAGARRFVHQDGPLKVGLSEVAGSTNSTTWMSQEASKWLVSGL